MADPEWFIEDTRKYPEAAADVEEAVRWLVQAPTSPEASNYIMQAAFAALALQLHRTGGGLWACRYRPLRGTLVLVGQPARVMPDTLETACAMIVALLLENDELRAQIAAQAEKP